MDNLRRHHQLSLFDYVTRDDFCGKQFGFDSDYYRCNRRERWGNRLISPLREYLLLKDLSNSPLVRVTLRILAVVCMPFVLLGVFLKKWGERRNPGYLIREKIFILKEKKLSQDLQNGEFYGVTLQAWGTLYEMTALLVEGILGRSQGRGGDFFSSCSVEGFAEYVRGQLEQDDLENRMQQGWFAPFARIFQMFQEDPKQLWRPADRKSEQLEILRREAAMLDMIVFDRLPPVAILQSSSLLNRDKYRFAFTKERDKILKYVQEVAPTATDVVCRKLEGIEGIIKGIDKWQKRSELDRRIDALYGELQAVYIKN